MLQFHSGKPPKGFKPSFEYYLFNVNVHRKLQSAIGWKEFHAIDNSSKKILASIFFSVDGAKAISPQKAPFGSFDYSEKLGQEDLLQFIQYVNLELKDEGIREVEITNAPELYYNDDGKLTSALKSQGYSAKETTEAASIIVTEQPLQTKLHKSKKRQLIKSTRAGFEFKILKANKLKMLFQFINTCRKDKGQSLSMSYKELNAALNELPNGFILAGVYDGKTLISASVCVRVRSDILYSFYPAHNASYNSYSPMTFLLSHLYDWCQLNKIRLLDLGTSASKDKTNASLLEYKLRVGGTLNSKIRFHKTLH